MALYAIITNSVVTKLVSPPDGKTLSDLVTAGRITAAQEADAVIVPKGIHVRVGTPYVNNTFVTPTPPPRTPAQQAGALIASGIVITSASGNWTSTFAVIGEMMGNSIWTILLFEQDALDSSNHTKFADGSPTVSWVDINNVTRILNPAQFVSLKTAIGHFSAKCRNYAIGVVGAVLPVNTYTID